MTRSDAATLEERLLAGDRRARARILTEVEVGSARGLEAMRVLYPKTGRAQTIGITGSPGAGKSTVTNALAKEYRARDRSVGIVAVDPSSPFTQGAILGDRVRMQELTADKGVFMRSLASRGSLGGLSEGSMDVILVLDAFGKDVILIETVGAGQDEVEIAGTAQTTLLINTPGMGDDIQAMKAGIMEIANVLAVNKADLPGADIVVSQLSALLSLASGAAWDPPIVKMIATEGEGIRETADACDRHHAYLLESGEMAAVERGRARRQIVALARTQLLSRLVQDSGGEERLGELVAAVAEREVDPHTAVERWLHPS
ncbi:MAG: methylmalonyl Co-A mutase-associated GTPase MeaB [Chloroflexi bacterium]|nr:methylmalonyl Co-A mutase-associated GTPase MeaB [Chloroflexota bacterium]